MIPEAQTGRLNFSFIYLQLHFYTTSTLVSKHQTFRGLLPSTAFPRFSFFSQAHIPFHTVNTQTSLEVHHSCQAKGKDMLSPHVSAPLLNTFGCTWNCRHTSLCPFVIWLMLYYVCSCGRVLNKKSKPDKPPSELCCRCGGSVGGSELPVPLSSQFCCVQPSSLPHSERCGLQESWQRLRWSSWDILSLLSAAFSHISYLFSKIFRTE